MRCPDCREEVEIPESARSIEDAGSPHPQTQRLTDLERRPSEVKTSESPEGDTVAVFLAFLGWVSIVAGVVATLYLFAKMDSSPFANSTAAVVAAFIGFVFVILGAISIGVGSAIQRLIR